MCTTIKEDLIKVCNEIVYEKCEKNATEWKKKCEKINDNYVT